MFCAKCGKRLEEDACFCGQCGAPVERAEQAPAGPREAAPQEHGEMTLPDRREGVPMHTLVISRSGQFVGSVMPYEVRVDGRFLSKLAPGKSVSTRVFSDTVRVEIHCASFLVPADKAWKWVELTDLNNPRVDFSIGMAYGGGTVNLAVSGARVLREGDRKPV